MLSDVLGRMRLVAQRPDPKLTCNKVIDIVGPRSHILAILIFGVLNLLFQSFEFGRNSTGRAVPDLSAKVDMQ